MNECLFCKIANHELDSDTVHETDDVIAFRDINPTAPTHVLVIPKQHIRSAKELSPDTGDIVGKIFEAAGVVADKEGLSSGYRLVTNVGSDAGQLVQHLHFHLIGGRSLSWPPG